MNFTVAKGGNGSVKTTTVTVRDRNGTDVAHSNKLSDLLTVTNAKLWWPYTQSRDFGYMYTLEVNPYTLSCL